jgi:hypothetical protein
MTAKRDPGTKKPQSWELTDGVSFTACGPDAKSVAKELVKKVHPQDTMVSLMVYWQDGEECAYTGMVTVE